MRFLLARHGETVHNRDGRMQGNTAHTPVTRMGIAQAEAMGAALTATLAATEHLGRDFFSVRVDPRLREMEISAWEGRRYEDIVAAYGKIICLRRRIFTVPPPGGETYVVVAKRLSRWLRELPADREQVVISHGMTLRVLRGLISGGEMIDGLRLGIEVQQGSLISSCLGVETYPLGSSLDTSGSGFAT